MRTHVSKLAFKSTQAFAYVRTFTFALILISMLAIIDVEIKVLNWTSICVFGFRPRFGLSLRI